jgi:hypothetical protein
MARKGRKKSKAWYATHPSPLSNPKEIAGHHAHKPHGPSIRWPALYEHLKLKGMTKTKAAMISNGLWRKKHGLPPKSVPKTKGKIGIGRVGSAGGGSKFTYKSMAPMNGGMKDDGMKKDMEPMTAEMSSGGKPLDVASREKAAEKGFALPDGKLPIRNVDELKAAVKLRGKVEGHTATEIRNHIVARAKALDAMASLPPAWKKKSEA